MKNVSTHSLHTRILFAPYRLCWTKFFQLISDITKYKTNNLRISGNSTIKFLPFIYKLFPPSSTTFKVSESFWQMFENSYSFTLVWRECQFKAKYLKNYAFRREKCRHFALNHPLYCCCCLPSVLNRVECCLLSFDDILGLTFKMKN